jgi:hypothetical protein
MSVTFEILNISIEDLNESESMILINFLFECKEKNLTWKFDKPYEILYSYFRILSSKIPDIPKLPLLNKQYILEQNQKEQFMQNLKEYLSVFFKRKEVYTFSSFQRLFEFPDSITEKIITIDTLSNINENNIIDFYFYDPFLFISCGNSNSSRALSFLFSYFQSKGSLITYKFNSTPGAYGEKKLIEMYKKDSEYYVTKIKKIKNLLFCGFGDCTFDIFNLNKEKNDFYIYSRIEMEKSAINLNNNAKIANIFYNDEKGYVYIFLEKTKKVSIYEINYNKHIKDIELSDNDIDFSYINFKMGIIFVVDSNGTFWMYELNTVDNTVKLAQASYTKFYDISFVEIYREKNNDQTLNIFIGKNDKIYLYQYSNKNNNFNLILICDVKYKITYIIYLKVYKCLFVGCNNGTIQIWKDTSKMPEYIIDSGYEKINKLFFDENNKYLFICDDRNIKILEINIENILNNENKTNEKDINNKNIINISETLKDESDKTVENNVMLIGKAFQTPISSDKKNSKKEDEIKIENKIDEKEAEIQTNSSENEYKYEVNSIGSLDGWDEW